MRQPSENRRRNLNPRAVGRPASGSRLPDAAQKRAESGEENSSRAGAEAAREGANATRRHAKLPRRPGNSQRRRAKGSEVERRVSPTAPTAPVTYDDAIFEVADLSASSAQMFSGASARTAGSAHEAADIQERRKERKNEKRRMRLTRLARVGGGALGILLVVWAVFFSPLLALQAEKITVTGVPEGAIVTNEEVADVAAAFAGRPLTRISGAAVGDYISSVIPEVSQVQVEKNWPRGIDIQVQMREAVVCMGAGGECSPVDREGNPLRVTEETKASLPRIGAAPGAGGQGVENALEVLSALDADIRAQVESVQLENSNHVVLKIAGGKTVKWGDASRPQMKAQVLWVLLGQPGTVYDISEPSAAVVK